MKTLIVTMASLVLLAGPALAADAPAAYKKCKVCHGDVGAGNAKVGPDLAKSTLSEEQVANQVTHGSVWEGKPAPIAGYEKKKMPAQKGVSADDVKAIYAYIHGK